MINLVAQFGVGIGIKDIDHSAILQGQAACAANLYQLARFGEFVAVGFLTNRLESHKYMRYPYRNLVSIVALR